MQQGYDAPSKALLSERQRQCLLGIASGLTSQQIAAKLGLSRRTVDHYVRFACAKLGVRTRAQAVAMGIRLKIISPSPEG